MRRYGMGIHFHTPAMPIYLAVGAELRSVHIVCSTFACFPNVASSSVGQDQRSVAAVRLTQDLGRTRVWSW